MRGACSTYERDEKCIEYFGRKSKRKRPLLRLGCKGEDNIRIDLGEISWEVVDWIRVAQDRDQCQALVNMVMNLRFHKRRGIY
jgi:hypothetical protein